MKEKTFKYNRLKILLRISMFIEISNRNIFMFIDRKNHSQIFWRKEIEKKSFPGKQYFGENLKFLKRGIENLPLCSAAVFEMNAHTFAINNISINIYFVFVSFLVNVNNFLNSLIVNIYFLFFNTSESKKNTRILL